MTQSTKTPSPTRSRDKVLQTLYEIEISGQDLKQVLKNHSLGKNNLFYKEMLKGVFDVKEKIDEVLSKNSDRLIESLDSIERNILRIAIYELQIKKVDSLVVISEAIRMSKKYGSSGGYKLINGILDNIVKKNQA
tara:strand:- start:175 stop:579 length:405 start_codon:yes stop_codon:yes gene_type:complete